MYHYLYFFFINGCKFSSISFLNKYFHFRKVIQYHKSFTCNNHNILCVRKDPFLINIISYIEKRIVQLIRFEKWKMVTIVNDLLNIFLTNEGRFFFPCSEIKLFSIFNIIVAVIPFQYSSIIIAIKRTLWI